REPIDEAAVAVDELHLAFVAKLRTPALLVFAPVVQKLLGLGAGRKLRLRGTLRVGHRGIAFTFGLGEQGEEGLQGVHRFASLKIQLLITAHNCRTLAASGARWFMSCCSNPVIGPCRRTARSRSASWPGA